MGVDGGVRRVPRFGSYPKRVDETPPHLRREGASPLPSYPIDHGELVASQTTLEAPAAVTPVAKCAMCPHKDTWVSCICSYELHDEETVSVDSGL